MQTAGLGALSVEDYHHLSHHDDQLSSIAIDGLMDFSMFPATESSVPGGIFPNSNTVSGNNNSYPPLYENSYNNSSPLNTSTSTSTSTSTHTSSTNNNSNSNNSDMMNLGYYFNQNIPLVTAADVSVYPLNGQPTLAKLETPQMEQLMKQHEIEFAEQQDYFFVNDLLTPPESAVWDLQSSTASRFSSGSSLSSEACSVSAGRNGSSDIFSNTSSNNQVLSFSSSQNPNQRLGFGFSNYNVFNNDNDRQSNSSIQLSSPLNSPKSLASIDSSIKDIKKGIRKSNSISGFTLESQRVAKPPFRTKKSKTVGDIRSTLENLKDLDFNPDIKNEFRWVDLSEIDEARTREILALSQKRGLKANEVLKTLNLFNQKHIMLKLKIINKKIGQSLQEHPLEEHEKVPCMTLKEDPKNLKLLVHTSSGYDSIAVAQDSSLCELRHIPILKDLKSYKTHDEMMELSKHSKPDEKRIKRPLNKFMLYRTAMIRAANILKVVELVSEDRYDVLQTIFEELDADPQSSVLDEIVGQEPKLDHHMAGQVVSLLWNTESKQVQENFDDFAEVEKAVHNAVHPKYKFNPQKKHLVSK